jgi:hypothetical protein
MAGMGRWRDAQVVLDSLRDLDQEQSLGITAWATALGLAPSSSASVLDSAVGMLEGPVADYARGLTHMFQGQTEQGRRQVARALASHSTRPIPAEIRGLLIATDGLGMVLQGDSSRGIRRMREGLTTAAAPGQVEDTAFLRLQLALALAARPETRAEGIRWLRYGFNSSPLYKPLTFLALGRAYEAAGQRDSAGYAFGRFLRLWDKADPELQGRVNEAREALQELSREQTQRP